MEDPPPRVLIFPLPAQGHVSSMLQLAELLCLSGLHVSFLNTDHIHDRLLRHGGAASIQRYPGFSFRTIPDGLPEDHPRTAQPERVPEFLRSLKSSVEGSLKQILATEPITCIIADGLFGNFIIDFGCEVQIPVIIFRTASASYLWTCFSVPHIIQACELPTRGDDEDKDLAIRSVAGMENFLRYRDLPRFGSSGDTDHSTLKLMASTAHKSCGAAGLILNTFQDLEGPIVSHIRAHCNPKTYSIGPLHAHLKHRILLSSSTTKDNDSNDFATIFPLESACIEWLDSHPPNSVIYVCFGSLALLKRDQLMEFWHGLVNSKKRFLWAIRADLLALFHQGPVPHELSEGTAERGLMAGWVPQEAVLNHRAVGGFLTHSGWNSTLESIVAGVPMICWPCFGDQQVNSRFVGEVWKLGIDMKDVCDRKAIEKMVNDLMVERRDEFARSTAEMAGLAKTSVREGGSSYRNFNSLVQDIKMMRK